MQDFHYKALPINVYFGNGESKKTKSILAENGYSSVLVITTPEQKETGLNMAKQLGELVTDVYPHAVMHVQLECCRRSC